MTTTATATTTWSIDPAHSNAEFSVKHMMISTVKGRFGAIEGTLEIDEAEPTRSSVRAEAEVATVTTGAADRDAHLRSDDFFNVERFPKMTFESTSIQKVDDSHWKMAGDLTIRDITRGITFDVDFDGRIVDAFGKDRAGFTAETRINRKDFGMNWNGVIEAGGVVVSDSVKISLNIAAVRQG